MQIIIDRIALKTALGKVKSVVQSGASLPILSTIRLTAKGGGLSIEATNLESSALAMVRCAVPGDGGTCVPYKRLLGLVSALDAEHVTLRRDTSEVLHVSAGASRSRMSCIHVSEYPTMPSREQMRLLCSVEASALLSAVDGVKRAQGSDASRPSFTGALWAQEGASLTLTATDGHRLHRASLACEPHAEGATRAVLPGLGALRAMVGRAESVRVLASGDNEVAFETDDGRLVLRTLPGRFPDVERVIPDVDAPGCLHKRLTFANARALADAIKRALLAAPSTGNVGILADGARALVCAEHGEEGASHREEVGGASIDDGAPESRLNGGLALDALAMLGGDAVEVWTMGGDAPIVWRTPGDPARLALVMPMQY